MLGPDLNPPIDFGDPCGQKWSEHHCCYPSLTARIPLFLKGAMCLIGSAQATRSFIDSSLVPFKKRTRPTAPTFPAQLTRTSGQVTGLSSTSCPRLSLVQDMHSTSECLLQETHMQREQMKGKQLVVDKLRGEIANQRQKMDRAALQV